MRKNNKRVFKQERKAFALVLALALMGFMVLLVVTLATMVQMQLRLSKQAITEQKARQSAKFAAYQAMSRIQLTLGPDRRITANAMMFDDILSPGLTDLESNLEYSWWDNPMDITREDVDMVENPNLSQNRRWVGVWQSGIGMHPDKINAYETREDYALRMVNSAMTWLVSGNAIRDEEDREGLTLKHKPLDALESGQYVRAVSKNSYGTLMGEATPELDVLAPLVTLTKDIDPLSGGDNSNSNETRIAWWVSDEGQKASLNAVASKEFFDYSESIEYRIQSLPFYSGIHGLSVPGMYESAFSLFFDDEGQDSSMAKIRSLSDIKQLDVIKNSELPPTVQLSKLFFHDVTFDTKGVLSNTREGGLKKDLSLGLTRLDRGNEMELLTDDERDDIPEYFPFPYGVAGYDYKTTAYPLTPHVNDRRFQDKNERSKTLSARGHIFGPQQYGHEDITKIAAGTYEIASAIAVISSLYTDAYIFKDPGGPLWDQLRSYYNLRTENNYDSRTLNSRVQTDDRWGFKPVLKRFQVFYVPTFSNWGNNWYGVRLHIIPLLILWNPFDTYIAGDTYYALRLSGGGNGNPIGTYRFAVGYERSGSDKFHCIRDLRTESIPMVVGANTSQSTRVLDSYFDISSNSTARAYHYPLGYRGTYNHNNWTSYQGAEKTAYSQTWSYDNTSRGEPLLSDFNGGVLSILLDTNTYWFARKVYPLGYGSYAPASITTVNSNPRSKYHYTALTANLAPESPYSSGTLTDAEEAANKAKFATYSSGTTTHVGVVAKVPLYLNSLIASVAHGSIAGRGDGTGLYNELFRPQRIINSKTLDDRQDIGYGEQVSGDLHFVVYDKSGIPPGQAKVFSMKSMVNYVGSGDIGDTRGYQHGPNGFIDSYEDFGAMLHGIDDGGTIGAGFYLDVPHPAREHEFKHRESNNYSSDGFSGEGSMYALFNTSHLSSLSAKDSDGNTMIYDVNQLSIDMQDVAALQMGGLAGTGGATPTPFYGAMNATPIGYGITGIFPDPHSTLEYSTWSSNNAGASPGDFVNTQRLDTNYAEIRLDMWIINREGFELSKVIDDSQTIQYDSVNLEQTPTMTYIKGYRFYLGPSKPSFPDPTMSYNIGTKPLYNWFVPGNVATHSQPVYLLPFSSHYFTSNVSSSYGTMLAKVYSDEVTEGDGTGGLDSTDSTNYRDFNYFYRYYLNWLPIDPRRHSANYWSTEIDSSDKVLTSSDNRGYSLNLASTTAYLSYLYDTNPKAVNPTYVPTVSSNSNYAAALNSYIKQGSENTPYAMVFGRPYTSSKAGAQSFFNQRMLVNSTLLATAYDYEGSGRPVNFGNNANGTDLTENSAGKLDTYQVFGVMQRTVQAMNLVYSDSTSDTDDSIGVSEMGYDVNPLEGYVRTGLSSDTGTLISPIHHILRKEEVVSNPANLSGVNLSFGVGITTTAGWETDSGQNDNEKTGWRRSYGIGTAEALQASFPIGNSLCPSRISPNRAFEISWIDASSTVYKNAYQGNSTYSHGDDDGIRNNNWYEDKSVNYDMAWNLNNKLWDDYFFSTLPYREDEDEDLFDVEYAFPQNPRLEYYVSQDDYLRNLELRGVQREYQYAQNASKLWINGPFNINSTSVDAWKTVLSTYFGVSVKAYDGSEVNDITTTPFHRWQAPYKALAFTADHGIYDEVRYMQGYRTLTPEEIEELACAMVEHVKDRGPFYSMADFVNRVVEHTSAEERFTDSLRISNLLPIFDLGEDREHVDDDTKGNMGDYKYKPTHMQKGVLQAAIDGTRINEQFHNDEDLIISISLNNNMSEAMKSNDEWKIFQDPTDTWENWRGAIGPMATGVPGYLMQQDILSRLGSFMTARSDTFKIRAYGEVRNPVSGVVEGKAWCEMVVQRTPEYIEKNLPSQEAWRTYDREFETGAQENRLGWVNSEPLDELTDELEPINQVLGRRFKIQSFRWLNENEI